MRILQFRSTVTFAGAEATLLTLDAPLRRLGISPKIVAYYRRRPPEPTVHRLIEDGRRLGVDVEQWEDDCRIS